MQLADEVIFVIYLWKLGEIPKNYDRNGAIVFVQGYEVSSFDECVKSCALSLIFV